MSNTAQQPSLCLPILITVGITALITPAHAFLYGNIYHAGAALDYAVVDTAGVDPGVAMGVHMGVGLSSSGTERLSASLGLWHLPSTPYQAEKTAGDYSATSLQLALIDGTAKLGERLGYHGKLGLAHTRSTLRQKSPNGDTHSHQSKTHPYAQLGLLYHLSTNTSAEIHYSYISSDIQGAGLGLVYHWD